VRYLSPTRLRVSFGCWNTPDEVDALAAALPALLD
jgi:selenocysteine lyase/cysteine desulfurase